MFLATGFTDLSSGGTAPCTPGAGSIPADFEDHAVTATITGLDPNQRSTTSALSPLTPRRPFYGQPHVIPGPRSSRQQAPRPGPLPPLVSTRALTHVAPRPATTSNTATKAHAIRTPAHPHPADSAGNGETFELVSQQLTGLKANTTYHYRIVADNGVPGGIAYGSDAIVTTRSVRRSFTHGHFPGPPAPIVPGSRSIRPDLGGNSVLNSLATSSDGERVLYGIEGGNPGSQNGGGLFYPSNYHLAERSASGWKTNSIFPTRAQATGNEWTPRRRAMIFLVSMTSTGMSRLTGDASMWRLSPEQSPQGTSEAPIEEATESLYQCRGRFADTHYFGGQLRSGASDRSEPQRVYDVTSGTPHLVDLMPDGSVPPCGAEVTRGIHPFFRELGVTRRFARRFLHRR